MRLEQWIAGLAVAAALGFTPAHAEECTDDELGERQSKVMQFIADNPDKEADVMALIAKAEERNGGEPPREKICEEMRILVEEIGKL